MKKFSIVTLILGILVLLVSFVKEDFIIISRSYSTWKFLVFLGLGMIIVGIILLIIATKKKKQDYIKKETERIKTESSEKRKEELKKNSIPYIESQLTKVGLDHNPKIFIDQLHLMSKYMRDIKTLVSENDDILDSISDNLYSLVGNAEKSLCQGCKRYLNLTTIHNRDKDFEEDYREIVNDNTEILRSTKELLESTVSYVNGTIDDENIADSIKNHSFTIKEALKEGQL